MRVSIAAGLLALTAVAGCTPEQRPPAAPRSEPPPPPARVSKAIDRSALLAHVRLTSTAAAARVLGTEPGGIAQRLGLPSSLDAALVEDAPVHVLVALDPNARGVEPLRAVVLEVRSGDAVRQAAASSGLRYERAQGASGARALLTPPARDYGCVLSGDARRALVCSPNLAEAQALVAYATEQLPNEPSPEPSIDVSAELRLEPLRRQLGPKIHELVGPMTAAALGIESRNAGFDRAVAQLVNETSAELAALSADVEEIRAQLRRSADAQHVTAVIHVQLRGRDSASVQALEAQATEAAPAPEAFLRLAADSHSALFVHGLDSARFGAPKRLLGKLFEQVLSYQGTPPKLHRAAAELVAGVPLPYGTLIVSSGSLPTASPRSRKPREPSELAAERAALGWRMVRVEGSADRYKSYFLELARAFDDPVLGPQMRRLILAQGGDPPLSVRVRPPHLTVGFPKATQLLEIVWPAREIDPRQGKLVPTRAPGMKALLAIVPEPQTGATWFALSGDEQLLRSRLRPRAPMPPRALDPSFLAELRRGAFLAGGFYTPLAWRGAAAVGPGSSRAPLLFAVTADAERQAVVVESSLPGELVSERLTELFAQLL